MKKFKLFFAVLVCAIVSCPLFAGCFVKDATYIKDSFVCTYAYNSGSSWSYMSTEYSFYLNVGKKGTFYVSYVLKFYEDEIKEDNLLSTVERTDDFTSEGNEKRRIAGSRNINVDSECKIKCVLSDIKVTRERKKDEFKAYAIGFGVVGGLLLCGITAYFIVDKLVLSKKNKD